MHETISLLYNTRMVLDGLTFLGGGHIPRCIDEVDMRRTFHTLEFMQSGGVSLRYGKSRASD